MMTKLTAAVAACLAAAVAQATCIYPRGPERLPDGNSASFDEMLEAQKAVKQFNDDVNAYNACLDLELKAFAESGQFNEMRLEELKVMQAKKHNAAVDEVQALADRFNEQLRVYNARTKKK